MVGKGRKKIEITRIVDKPKRSVTFSNRRKGLFKKSAELDVLCGSDTAIISVSEAGTIFAAGRPSFVHSLLLGSARARGGGGGCSVEFDDDRLKRMGWDELATEHAALNNAQLKIELLMMMMMERNNSNNGNAVVLSDFTGDLPAFSSSASHAHVFVDDAAAAAAAPPDVPAFNTPSLASSFSSDSVMSESAAAPAPAPAPAAPLDVPAFTTPSLAAFSSAPVVDAAAAAAPPDIPPFTTPSLASFSSASVAHVFVDAAAAAALPDIPAFTAPSSSELDWSELSELEWSELEWSSVGVELSELDWSELDWSSVAVDH